MTAFINSQAQSLKGSFETYERLPNWFNEQLYLREYGDYIIDEEMNPLYLEADFNGEGKMDIAICIAEPTTNKKGILIHHREDRTFYILGAGKEFNNSDNFTWLEVWKLYRETTAEQTLFSENYDIVGSETVKLKNIAIEIAKFESASNLITWDGEQYVWIHTGD